MNENQNRFLRSFINFSIFFISFMILTLTVPAQQPPTFEVYMELNSYDEHINTSPDVSEHSIEVEGIVTLDSRTPMYIEVNLTVENDWTVIIEPANFTMSVQQGLVQQDITVTVIAPLGVINNTEHTVRITGSWSFFQGIGGGEIEPVTLNLVAQNSTTQSNGNNGNNGDNKGNVDDGASGDGFFDQYGTEVLIAVVVIVVIIVIILMYRRRRDYEDE